MQFCRALAVGIVAVLGLSGVAARADIIVHYGFPGNSLTQTLERYSDGGTDLGLFASFLQESCDGIYSGSNGDVYALADTLGDMTILRYNSGGQHVATSNAPYPFASNALTVRGSTLYMGSSSAGLSGNLPGLPGGIYAYNPQTLAATGTLQTLPAVQSNVHYTSFAFSQDGTTLFASTADYGVGGQANVRAFASSGVSISFIPSFTLPISGQLAVSADGARLFVGNSQGISWYNLADPTDQSVHSFVMPGTAGITSIGSYLFAPGGDLYVTANTASGAELLLFNGNTGAFESNLTPLAQAGTLAYTVPECSFTTIAPVIAVMLLFARRRNLQRAFFAAA